MFLTSLKRYIIKGKNNMDIRNDFSSPDKWGKIMRKYGKKLKCPDTFFFYVCNSKTSGIFTVLYPSPKAILGYFDFYKKKPHNP